MTRGGEWMRNSEFCICKFVLLFRHIINTSRISYLFSTHPTLEVTKLEKDPEWSALHNYVE